MKLVWISLVTIILLGISIGLVIYFSDKEGYTRHFNNFRSSGESCLDNSFEGTSGPFHEIGECEFTKKYVGRCKNVLEIGGGTGKVSHYINQELKDKKKHYVVEPSIGMGVKFGKHIENNKRNHNDQYHIDKRKINDIPLWEIESKLGGKIDCIISDCEGCSLRFYENNPEVLRSVSMIQNEMDGNNEELRKLWKNAGFKHEDTGFGCGIKCVTEMWVKP